MNYLVSRAHNDITIVPFIYAFVWFPAGYGRSLCHGYIPLYSTICTVQYSLLTGWCLFDTELTLLHDPVRQRLTYILVQLHAARAHDDIIIIAMTMMSSCTVVAHTSNYHPHV